MGNRLNRNGYFEVNMEHCQFNNTEQAICQCLDTLDEGGHISGAEIGSMRQMFDEILTFCENEGIIECENDWEEALDEFVEQVKRR